MQLVERHIVKDLSFMEICEKSKRLYNASLYYLRQSIFKKIEYFNEYELTGLFAEFDQFDYRELPSQTNQQIIKLMFQNFKSWQKARKEYEKNPDKFLGRPKLPKYKKKTYVCIFTGQQIRIKDGFIVFPKSANLPSIKTNQTNVCQIRIIPKLNHCILELVYKVDDVEVREYNGKWMGIDLGVNNLVACTSNENSFIVNGKPLKSVNQGYNKTLAKMKAELPLLPKNIKTKTGNRIQKGSSKKIQALTQKRNSRINDFIHKTSRIVVNEAIKEDVTKIVIGNNKSWKNEINIGTKNNATFCSIPHDTLIEKIKYKAQMVGIEIVVTQEAYTSKCSAIDLEPIQKHETYLGKRKKRGLFKTKNGNLINADSNGSVNIARLGLSVSGNEIEISDSLVSCVSQPKKVNVLNTKTKLLKHFVTK